MRKTVKRAAAFLLTLAVVLTMSGFSGNVSAAGKKKVKLSAAKVTLKVGASKKVTVKNAPKKAKVTWKSKNKKIAKVNKSGKITGVKKGSAKIQATVKYTKKGKKVTRKFTVKVTVKPKTSGTAASEAPAASAAPSAAPSASQTPAASAAPAASETPAASTAPTESAEPEPTMTVWPQIDFSTDVTEQSNLGEEHQSANGITTRDNGLMRKDLKATDLMYLMGEGWNVGNSLEARLPDDQVTGSNTVTDFETAWSNVVTTQKTIDGIKSYGFNTVRIPVAWSNMVTYTEPASGDAVGTYTIDDAYLDRVEEVMNYCLNNEMYVIINIHWDGGWWGQFGSSDEHIREMGWARFTSYWNQIAERYKEYSDRVIFEAANEEIGDRLNDKVDENGNPDDTNGKSGVLTKDECYEVALQINQTFVDIVRSTGGNNTYRHLLVAGYNTDVANTCDERFIMPTDIEENGNTKLSVSVHYYTPSTYCISESFANSWGYRDNWGTEEDMEELHSLFDGLTKFTDAGYGVIIGEYGVCNASKDGIPVFMNEVMQYAAECGFCPVLWDSGIWYDRTTGIIKFKDIANLMNCVTGADGIVNQSAPITQILQVPVVDESELELQYTWEGIWTRTNGKSQSDPEHIGGYEVTSCDEGLTVETNPYYWQLFMTTDWSGMTRPCIRVTVADDETSKAADLQLGYVPSLDDPNWHNPVDFQAAQGWQGVCFELDKDTLAEYGVLMISSNNLGATITKIEIFDAR